jgi:hypothetical protein
MMELTNLPLKVRNTPQILIATRNIISGGKMKKECGLTCSTGSFLNSHCAPL